MRFDTAAPVAVVGGGFSGVMTAVNLARRGVPVRLFEGAGRVGRGIAYATRDPSHLLNVPAAKMSAWPDAPDDFVRWLGAPPGSFARRCDYGAYLRSILAAHPDVVVDQATVCALKRSSTGWQLTLGSGERRSARAVVLALGNEPPAIPSGWEGVEMLADPWSEAAQTRLLQAERGGGDILLIGTGLTMVDVMLSLDAANFQGRAVAVSRRGLIPRAHATHAPAPVSLADLPQGDLLALWRWLRRRSGEVGFRAAVDSLRPHSATLWQALSTKDRRRFLRHARPWWDVHRHRLAPEVAERLKAMISSGRLEILAGRLNGASDGSVTIAGRNGERRTLRPALVVNCTGPLGDVRRSANPLLRQLLADGLVEPDPLALGLRTDAQDCAASGLWALGPLTKGMYWEITAVPDIRAQAERVAGTIAEELAVHG